MSNLFAENLPPTFSSVMAVQSQVEKGMQGLHQTSDTLMQICTYQKGCPKIDDIVKRCEKRYAGMEDKSKHYPNYSKANNSILKSMDAIISQAHQQFLQKVSKEIGEPMRAYYKQNKIVRKKILEKLNENKKILTVLAVDVTKQKGKCDSSYKKFEKIKSTSDKDRINEKKDKLIQDCEAYAQSAKNAEDYRMKWTTGIVPKALGELEALERGRMRTIQDKFKAYNNLFGDLIEQLKNIQDTVLGIIGPNLDEDGAINTFAKSIESSVGDTQIKNDFTEMEAMNSDGDFVTKLLSRPEIFEKYKLSTPSEGVSGLRTLRKKRPTYLRKITAGGPAAVRQYFESKHGKPMETTQFLTNSTIEGDSNTKGEHQNGFLAVAIYEYIPEDPTDQADGYEYLSFSPDEKIQVISCEGEWWEGIKLSTNKQGYFPSDYVKKLETTAIVTEQIDEYQENKDQENEYQENEYQETECQKKISRKSAVSDKLSIPDVPSIPDAPSVPVAPSVPISPSIPSVPIAPSIPVTPSLPKSNEPSLYAIGEEVEALWEDGEYYSAVIKAQTDTGYTILFPEYQHTSVDVPSTSLQKLETENTPKTPDLVKKKVHKKKTKPSGGGGGRGDLLSQIQAGKKLKKAKKGGQRNSKKKAASKRPLTMQEEMALQMKKRGK